MVLAIVVALWLLCSLGAWGVTLSYFDTKFPFFNHRRCAAVTAVFGPIGLIVAIFFGGLHWKLRPYSKQEAWEAHQQRWPILSYADFEEDW